MATAWWWPPLPAWLGSEAVWFVALNAVVAAVAILSSRARRPSQATPRRGAAGVTRRVSSAAAVLQSLRSFSLFSFPSACMSFLQPDAAATACREAEELVVRPPTKPSPSPRARARAVVVPPPPPVAAAAEQEEDNDDDEDEEGDPNAMSLDEAYALVLASRLPEREEEARRSEDVDARADEFIRGFKEDLRQQRLNSIFNYTQMLKQRRGLAAGRRHAEAGPDQL